MVSWVPDRNIFKILYYRAHYLVVRRRGGRYIDDIQLIDFKLLSSKSNKCICVLRRPEVDVESMDSEKVFSLVARIGVWESPVMFRLLHRRRCPLMMAAVAVDYDGTQGRMFMGLAHNCRFHSCNHEIQPYLPQRNMHGMDSQPVKASCSGLPTLLAISSLPPLPLLFP